MLLRSELVAAFAFLYALSLAERASDVPKSMITPAPELRKRQTIEPYGSRSDFIGYYVLGSACNKFISFQNTDADIRH
jgi:hypothetical protein